METVADVMRRPFYMDSTRAKEFGVIDKVGYCQFCYRVFMSLLSCPGLIQTDIIFWDSDTLAWSGKDNGRCRPAGGLGQECWD